MSTQILDISYSAKSAEVWVKDLLKHHGELDEAGIRTAITMIRRRLDEIESNLDELTRGKNEH